MFVRAKEFSFFVFLVFVFIIPDRGDKMTAIRLRCVSIAGGGAAGRWDVFYELALLGEPSDSIQVLPVPYAVVVCWIMKIVLEKNREE